MGAYVALNPINAVPFSIILDIEDTSSIGTNTTDRNPDSLSAVLF